MLLSRTNEDPCHILPFRLSRMRLPGRTDLMQSSLLPLVVHWFSLVYEASGVLKQGSVSVWSLHVEGGSTAGNAGFDAGMFLIGSFLPVPDLVDLKGQPMAKLRNSELLCLMNTSRMPVKT